MFADTSSISDSDIHHVPPQTASAAVNKRFWPLFRRTKRIKPDSPCSPKKRWGRRAALLLVGALVILVAGVCVLLYPKWRDVQAVRGIIELFEDGVLSEDEVSGYSILFARLPKDERDELEAALARIARGEIVLEKAWTAESRIPMLIVKPRGDGPFPAVLFMHGVGGFGLIGKETAVPYFAKMVDRGYAMVAFDARHFGERGGIVEVARIGEEGIYPDIVIPTATEDVFEVAGYVGARSDVDPSRLGMFGYSMGGLIAVGALAHDKDDVLRAVVCASGGANFDKVAEVQRAHDRHVPDLPDSVLASIRAFDPIHHVEKLFPAALLLIHGRQDSAAPVEGAESLYNEALGHYSEKPDRIKLHLVDSGHDLYPEWMDDAFDWFDQYLADDSAISEPDHQ